MTDRKITLMHKIHGRCSWRKCGECPHFLRYQYKGKTYRKCAAYGDTRCEATDWNASYSACGLFLVKDISGCTGFPNTA